MTTMWDRYAIWCEEDELRPLKVVGAVLWVMVCGLLAHRLGIF